MELTGERTIQAPRETVFAALNDPDILRQAIPGCESLEKTSEQSFDAVVTLKVGPVKAKFNGSVTLDDLNPPESYSLIGEGKGGAAGFASGKADVRLQEGGTGTLLTYKVQANLGGKIAQLGSRLVQGTANKLSGEFFSKFGELVDQKADATTETAAEIAESATEPAPASPSAATAGPSAPTMAPKSPAPVGGGSPTWLWWAVGSVVVLVVIAFALL
ncbi:MAG: CoxG family protein [Kiloniellales bacterium]